MEMDVSKNKIKFYLEESDRPYYSGYSVGIKFYEKDSLIFDYFSGLSRNVFFEHFKSSKLIDGIYLPIGGCEGCDDFGCERFVTKFTNNHGIISFNNIYELSWDNTPSLIKEFYFEIEESELVRNIEKLKDVII